MTYCSKPEVARIVGSRRQSRALPSGPIACGAPAVLEYTLPMTSAEFQIRRSLEVLILAALFVAMPAFAQGSCSATTVSAASYWTEAVAPDSIVSTFGLALAPSTELASVTPLPVVMASTKVFVTDSQGTQRPSGLFFVSPGQINHLIPAETALGQATITVERSDGSLCAGQVQIEAVTPSLFSAHADGRGVAAGQYVRATAGGEQEIKLLFDSSTGQPVSVSIEPGPETDQVALVLYGTGLRGAAASTVRARMGGQDLQVLYIGPQGQYAGEDQLNLLLPRSVFGHGDTNLLLSIAGKPVNLVSANLGGAPVEQTAAEYLPVAPGMSWQYRVEFPAATNLPYEPGFEEPQGLLCASGLSGLGSWQAGETDFRLAAQDSVAGAASSWHTSLDAQAFKFFFYLSDPVSSQNDDPAQFELRNRTVDSDLYLDLISIIPIGDPRWRLVRVLAWLPPAALAQKSNLTVRGGEFRGVVQSTWELGGSCGISGTWTTDMYMAPHVGLVKAVGKSPDGTTVYTMELTRLGL